MNTNIKGVKTMSKNNTFNFKSVKVTIDTIDELYKQVNNKQNLNWTWKETCSYVLKDIESDTLITKSNLSSFIKTIDEHSKTIGNSFRTAFICYFVGRFKFTNSQIIKLIQKAVN